MSLLVQQGLVSTIIPVFNRPEFAVEAIDSVLTQDYRPIEIIVVDDGSTDETPKVLASLAEQHPEVRLFHQANAGPGSARELGRLNARGEYVQYLDSDDLLLQTKFSSQVSALIAAPTAVAAYGKTEVVSVLEKPRQIAHRLTGTERLNMFPEFLRERWWFTSTPLYRRQAIEKNGPWLTLCNEEDWEYDCRLASHGGRLVFVDEFVSLHRRHDDHLSANGSTTPQKLADRARSRAKIFQHAKAYEQLELCPQRITADDWAFFSKYAFLLGRQCALAGLTTEARAMVSVSIEAIGRKTLQHRVFLKLVKFTGWQRAAKLLEKIGK